MSDEKTIDCEIYSLSIENTVPLITIELQDIDAVPSVYYKGKKIDKKVRVAFDWETNGNEKKPTYINLEHVKQTNLGIHETVHCFNDSHSRHLPTCNAE